MIRNTQSSSRLKHSSYTARGSVYLHRRRSVLRPEAVAIDSCKAAPKMEVNLEQSIKLPPKPPTPEISKRSEQFLPQLRHQNFL